MEKLIYIGTNEAEPYGIPFDYQKNDLFKMNRFLGFLIQNQDLVHEIIKTKFSIEKADLFISIISEDEEYEVVFFLKLETTRFDSIDLNDLVLKIENNCIVLSMEKTDLVFNLPVQDMLQRDFIFEGEELDFQELESYEGKCINLSNDDDFPHLFMSESQIIANFNYLTERLNQILSIIGLNSDVSKSELIKVFGEEIDI
jgi:hypothetical protein